MENTLMPDQYVLVDKLTPRFDAYHRGDIVVFNPPAAWTHDPRGHPVHQAGHRRRRAIPSTSTAATSLSTASRSASRTSSRPADAAERSERQQDVDARPGPALRDGRPQASVAGFARFRPDRQVGGHRPGLDPLLAAEPVRIDPAGQPDGSSERVTGVVSVPMTGPRGPRWSPAPAPHDRTGRRRGRCGRRRRRSWRSLPATGWASPWVWPWPWPRLPWPPLRCRAR